MEVRAAAEVVSGTERMSFPSGSVWKCLEAEAGRRDQQGPSGEPLGYRVAGEQRGQVAGVG